MLNLYVELNPCLEYFHLNFLNSRCQGAVRVSTWVITQLVVKGSFYSPFPHSFNVLICSLIWNQTFFFPQLYQVFVASHGLCSWQYAGALVGAHEFLVPWPGVEPTSPALQARFLTIGPQVKSLEAGLENLFLFFLRKIMCFLSKPFAAKVVLCCDGDGG